MQEISPSGLCLENLGFIPIINLFGLICDNKLFIKPTNAGRAFIQDVVEAPPYTGAKFYFLVEDKLEDRDWLSELVRVTVNELPEPKPRKRKRNNKHSDTSQPTVCNQYSDLFPSRAF